MFWRVLTVLILVGTFWLPQPKAAEAYLFANSLIEENAGEQFFHQIEGNSYGDKDVCKFFDRVRASMPEKSRSSQSVIRVLPSQEINAFCGPNGVFCVTQGALKFFSEEELAGILGHELGHSQKNHWAKMYEALVWTSIGAQRLANTGVVDGQTAKLINNVIQVAVTRGYGFDNEYEADRYGFEVMKRSTEFNPMALAMAFVRVSQMENSRGPQNQSFDNFSRPHPETENRISQQVKLLGEWAKNKVMVDAKSGNVFVDGKIFLNVGSADRSNGFRAAGILAKAAVMGVGNTKASTQDLFNDGSVIVYLNGQLAGTSSPDRVAEVFNKIKIPVNDITPNIPAPAPFSEEE